MTWRRVVAVVLVLTSAMALTTASRVAASPQERTTDPYRRWTSPKTISCTTGLGGVSVVVGDQNVEFSDLPANAQYTTDLIRNAVPQSSGPFPVEQTSGTHAYLGLNAAIAGYPVTFEYRINTFVDGQVVYRSSLSISCASDLTVAVNAVNTVVHDPDPYRRWMADKTYTCAPTTGGRVAVTLSNQNVEFNNLPANAQYTQTYIRNGAAQTDGPYPVEQTTGLHAYLAFRQDFSSYPFVFDSRLDTMVNGIVVYRSTLHVACSGNSSGSVTPINEVIGGGGGGGGGNGEYVPLVPARLVDTRPRGTTADGTNAGGGPVAGTYEVQVAGRGGVAADASAATLNVTAVDTQAPGYLTVYPCGGTRPTASNVNYTVGAVVPNAVLAKIGAGGKICIFSSERAQLVVDVGGYFPATSSYVPLEPGRLLDTRAGQPTIDGVQSGAGANVAGTTLVLSVAGRGGVPVAASSVALNVTVTDAAAAGFATVYPCGAPVPLASSLNYDTGTTVANLVVSGLGTDATVCLFTSATTHLVVDVNGYFPPATTYTPLQPARLLDTRSGSATIDGTAAGIGSRPAGSTTELVVLGRGGVPSDAGTVMLNVTATEPAAAGFVTVYPCGVAAPLASNLNYVAAQSVPNAVVAKVGADGKVCLLTSQPAQLVADVVGFFPA